MLGPYSFFFILDKRKTSLSKLSESQRLRLFLVIKDQFSLLYSDSNRNQLSSNQFKFLGIKIYRRRVRINKDCVGLPIRLYSGKRWSTIFVKKSIIGFPLSFFFLFPLTKEVKKYVFLYFELF